MLRRTHWQEQIARLDPEVDYEQIYRLMTTHEFPWDMNQSLSFALFRTYAVPSIGRLLDETGEFARDTQKRYDDTALLLDEVGIHGMHTPHGRVAIRRINQMHGSYDISNEDMRYVLSTFVVVPKRWMDDYGWRPFSPGEVAASVRYYLELGALMGIKDLPGTYAGFEALLDGYEAEHFGFDAGGRRVADATLALLLTFYPRVAAKGVEVFSRALMDPPLREAFGYRAPPGWVVAAARAGLRARARVEARLPARRTPQRARDLPRIRSYPNGFRVEELGTFPGAAAASGGAGCPVLPLR
ncbi:MAG: oxygenase MpaB family protein [Nocardioidaceae bacterium]